MGLGEELEAGGDREKRVGLRGSEGGPHAGGGSARRVPAGAPRRRPPFSPPSVDSPTPAPTSPASPSYLPGTRTRPAPSGSPRTRSAGSPPSWRIPARALYTVTGDRRRVIPPPRHASFVQSAPRLPLACSTHKSVAGARASLAQAHFVGNSEALRFCTAEVRGDDSRARRKVGCVKRRGSRRKRGEGRKTQEPVVRVVGCRAGSRALCRPFLTRPGGCPVVMTCGFPWGGAACPPPKLFKYASTGWVLFLPAQILGQRDLFGKGTQDLKTWFVPFFLARSCGLLLVNLICKRRWLDSPYNF